MRVVSTTQRLAKVPPTRHAKPATTRGKVISGLIGALIGIVLGAWSATAWPQAQWVADPIGVVAPPSSVVSVVETPTPAPVTTTVVVRPVPKPQAATTRTVAVTPPAAPSSAPQPPSAVPSSVPPAPSVSVSLPLPVG
jgi:hypothetical protein